MLDRVPPPDGVPAADFELVDLADARAAEAAVRAVADRAGGLDAVFTAAGTDRCGTLAEVPGEEWDRVVLVNLIGTAAVVRAALPYLERSHGRVVTCASTLGLRALSDATRVLRLEVRRGRLHPGARGGDRRAAIGVTMLVPGGMHTAFFDGRDEKYKPPADAKLNRPEDVARAVLFALRQPPGCEVRELVVTPSRESSWP